MRLLCPVPTTMDDTMALDLVLFLLLVLPVICYYDCVLFSTIVMEFFLA